MTGPAVVSVARIDQSWHAVPGNGFSGSSRATARATPPRTCDASSPSSVTATAFPRPSNACAEYSRPVRQTACARTSPFRSLSSSEPSADTPGTLYMNRLFEPGAPDELVEDIYMHRLTLAIFAAIQRTPKALVTWPHDDEIAARVVTAAAPPKGGVQ